MCKLAVPSGRLLIIAVLLWIFLIPGVFGCSEFLLCLGEISKGFSSIFTITVQTFARSLANFYRQ